VSFVAIILGCCALGLFVVQRLVWLAPTRVGWLFYLANIAGEIGPKRLGVRRELLEASVAFTGVVLLTVGGTPIFVVAVVIILLLSQIALLQRIERRFLVTAWVRHDRFGPNPAEPGLLRGLARGYPSPSTHPELTVTLNGPFVTRCPYLDLGTLVIGRRIAIEVLVGNHALTPTQTAIRLCFELPSCLHVDGDVERLLSPLAPGQVHRVSITLEPTAAAPRSWLLVQVMWGDTTCTHRIAIQNIVSQGYKVRNAAIRRYPGACRSAFAWRGDMDIYDTSTLQSIAGLDITFGLAARYRMPQTMYLSTRLSLDETAARGWAEHYGIDRGAGEIPRFIQWMHERVEFCHRADYPFESDRPYLVELGNHGHLHFGNDTSAAEENGWHTRSRMGAGVYPWLGCDRGSLAEQRDNALEARRWCEKLFGFTPRSWAMPDRTRDKNTAAAMEAAGCEVLSDSDVRTWDNILRQPKPHFATGSGAVELTKRYPGDPQHLLHYWMNLFWIHRAHRLGIPVVFMCHQHMRLFDGWACTRLTEGILRHVLHAFSGDLWINTVYGIGVYWRDVLSERRSVELSMDNGIVTVRSHATLAHFKVPVDLELEGGGHTTILVDLKPGSQVRLDARGLL
jgi:hypothetical protein